MGHTLRMSAALVNDGSRDDTWSVMGDLAASDLHVFAINLSRNYGDQREFTAGLQFTRGNRILIIDADMQDPPDLLPQMMCWMDDGADIAYGRRGVRKGETWFKRASASLCIWPGATGITSAVSD